jgi:hypothetical protein
MMRRSLVLVVLVVLHSLTVACAGVKPMEMDLTKDPQNIEFRKKIAYDDAITQHVASETVAFDWAAVTVPPGNWTISRMAHKVLNVNAYRESWSWVFGTGTQLVGIKVTAFQNDDMAAMRSISRYSHMSTMNVPPYKRGPLDLGTISIMTDYPGAYSVYWAYRDLQFIAEGEDKATVLAAAYWLQGIAESHRKPR